MALFIWSRIKKFPHSGQDITTSVVNPAREEIKGLSLFRIRLRLLKY
jgi:hypothetical protein